MCNVICIRRIQHEKNCKINNSSFSLSHPFKYVCILCSDERRRGNFIGGDDNSCSDGIR